MALSLKEHLKKFHGRMAEHSIAKSKAHGNLAKCFGKMMKMMKADDNDEGENLAEQIAEFLQELSDEDASMADFCVNCLSEVSKAQRDDDIEKAVDIGVSGVTPDNPMLPRAVIREGQRPMSEANATPVVPIQFQKLIEVEDGLD